MLASVSAETVIEWHKYFDKHGFTHNNQSLYGAQLCATVWNASPMGATKLATLSDFLLTRQDDPEPETVERTDEELMHLSASAGGVRIERPTN